MIYAIPGESFQPSDPIEFLSGSNQTRRKFCKPTKSYGDPGCGPTSRYFEFGWIRSDPTIGIRLNPIVWSDQPPLPASNGNLYCFKKIAFARVIRSQDEYYDSRIRPSNTIIHRRLRARFPSSSQYKLLMLMTITRLRPPIPSHITNNNANI
jgi:hypothetical protein